MKTNLDSLFKTSTKHESEGIWLDISEHTGFHVRRFGGTANTKIKQAHAKHYKPFARMIENDSMPESEQRKVLIKLFIDASMIGWRGIEIDGVETPYSPEAALKLFESLPELFDAVQKYASDFQNYKEDLGNS